MEFSFSNHALERLKDRNIDEETVWAVLDDPDSIVKESKCKHIYQKVIRQEDSTYLHRVFVNICKQPNLVITVYKTSKIDKYEY